MRHTCEHCAAPYEIPDDKVAGRFLKVRCKRCQGTMHVVGIAHDDIAGGQGTAGAAVWWCALANEPRGPYREDEVLSLVLLGDVHARTRMWCAGMPGWERVCESEALAWVYLKVIDAAAHDPSIMTLPSSVFDRAALLSDGQGWFPDPTLKSGIILLDAEMQRSLERLARGARREHEGEARDGAGPAALAPAGPGAPTGPTGPTGTRAQGTRAEAERSLIAPLAAAAVGAAAAASGLLWFLAGPTF
jgi:predicted Zn finger-like uncharacterized protein